ncbi:hypothetical protein ACQUEN_08575 [Lactococcus taiwanensis]|uniref:hypothetical protein n=1 Tax=Lactococcus taiwanensis TaxID=1151742 RepID=UPI003D0FC54E
MKLYALERNVVKKKPDSLKKRLWQCKLKGEEKKKKGSRIDAFMTEGFDLQK